MGQIIQGAKVKVEVGFTEGLPHVVIAVSLSQHPTVLYAGSALTAGSYAYFDQIEGMDPLDGQAIRIGAVGSPGAGSFGVQDLDTSDFPDFASGILVPITAWRTLSQSTQYQIGGGAAKTEDVTTLIDTRQKQLSIQNAAETVTIDVRSLTEDNDAMAKIRATGRALGYTFFRITLADGAVRIFRGQPSIPGESVQQGATGTGQLSVTVKGQVCYLPIV